jgi:outer membrane lipoprotein-sorting protein
MTRKAIALTFLACAALSIPASAQNVDELIKKNLEARGGLEKLKGIKTMRLTGKFHTEGMNIPLVIQIKRPGSVRGDALFQGMALVRAYDGETAWQINPLDGVKEAEPMTAFDTKEMIDIGDLDGPLVDYKAKGNTVELAGKEELEASPVYKLKVTLKDGDVKYLYLDAQNYLELKETWKRKEDGKVTDVDTVYSDYKAVAGVMIAHSWETRVNGELDDQTSLEKIEVNVPVDDSIFKLPKNTQEKKPSGH